MIIGLSGSEYAGKNLVESYLTQHRGFKLIAFGSPSEEFGSFEEVYDFITKNWRTNFVINVDDLNALNLLHKRPFFLHVAVDASLKLKFSNYQRMSNDKTLEGFMEKYDEDYPIKQINLSHFKIFLTTDSMPVIYDRLEELELWDNQRLRPSWDTYFMKLADLAALRSNCMKRRVGCVIVKDNRVVATGYNGTPRHLTNCNEGGCSRCNQALNMGSSLSTCLCLHAEENALLEAGRDRMHGSILYCNTCPCLTCSVKIIQTGVKEVVYDQSYSMDEHTHKLMEQANIILRRYKHSIFEVTI